MSTKFSGFSIGFEQKGKGAGERVTAAIFILPCCLDRSDLHKKKNRTHSDCNHMLVQANKALQANSILVLFFHCPHSPSPTALLIAAALVQMID
jgi:hypothetical protein